MPAKKRSRSEAARKVQGIFAPGTGGARDPDHVRKYLTDDDARELLARLAPEGLPHAALSAIDRVIVTRLRAKRAFTNAELVVMLHIQGVLAAISEDEL